MDSAGLLGIFCGITVFVGLSAATQLLSKKGKGPSLLLGFLYLAISLRVAKSIWYFILYDVAPIGLALGFLGLASIGPLLWLFIKDSKADKALNTSNYLHLIIPSLGFITTIFLPLEQVTLMYKSATVLLMIYALFSLWIAFKHNDRFLRSVTIGVVLIGACFSFQHISETMMAYAFGAAIAGLVLAYLSKLELVGSKRQKKEGSVPKDIIEKVRESFEVNKVYHQSDLSINGLAKDLKIPAYQIPKSVKELYSRTFPETVIYFRVKEAKSYLIDHSEFVKVENVAYQVGFKSASAFYASFKKETGKSPKEYREETLASGLKSTTVELAAS